MDGPSHERLSRQLVTHATFQEAIKNAEAECAKVEKELEEAANALKKREADLEAMKTQREQIADVPLALDLVDIERAMEHEIVELEKNYDSAFQKLQQHQLELSTLKERQRQMVRQNPAHGPH